MLFTWLKRILQHLLYSFAVIISFILGISVFMVIVSISDAHTEFDTENDMNYNKSIDYMEDVDKKYIPFMNLETILFTLMKYREYIVTAWLMCLPIFIYNLSREDWVRRYVRLVKLYLMTLGNWLLRLFHTELAVTDNIINQNDQDTRDDERYIIKLCQIQYYLILAVEELEETTQYGYYGRDLPEFCAILFHSVRAFMMLEERIHEDRDVRGASCPPHNILGRDVRGSSCPPHNILGRDVRGSSCPPHNILGRGLRLSQTSVASRSRNLIERLGHPRNPAREQELPSPELFSELLDQLRRICQNHGQDLPR